MKCCVAFLLLISCVPSVSRGQAERVSRLVEFRDGSRLWVALPDRVHPLEGMTPRSGGSPSTIRMSAISDLWLALRPAGPVLADIRRAVADLGSERFATREGAQRRLLDVGAGFEELLGDYRQRSRDLEVRWRLRAIIRDLREQAGRDSGPGFDTVQLLNGTRIIGDLGAWSESVEYRGHPIELGRDNVRLISQTIAAGARTDGAGPPQISRIAEDKDELFPDTVTRVDFELDPQGNRLKPGDDIRRRFMAWGFTMETSIPDAIVSVNSYNVGGRSGGQSAATHDPLWQGTLTIRFCVPGAPQAQATVRHVGFSVAAVVPNGTAMEAYDVDGRFLARERTVRGSRDFLAVRSSRPIAMIKVVPDPKLDRDFTIDDLVFDRPIPVVAGGDMRRFVVATTFGERLKGASVIWENDALTVGKPTLNVARLQIPRSEIRGIYPPIRLVRGLAKQSDRFWVMLSDGSLVFAQRREQFVCASIARCTIRPDEMAALWGESATYCAAPAGWWKPGRLLVRDGDGWAGCSPGEFGVQGVNSADWPLEKEHSYIQSPMMWLRAQPTQPTDAARLRLVTGETILLGPNRFFQFDGCDAAGVTLTHRDAVTTVPWQLVIALEGPLEERPSS